MSAPEQTFQETKGCLDGADKCCDAGTCGETETVAQVAPGVTASNVYDAYAKGRKSAFAEAREHFAQKAAEHRAKANAFESAWCAMDTMPNGYTNG